MTIMKQTVNQKSIIWALIYAISFVASVYVLSRYSIPVPVALLIIAINAILFGIYTIRLIQSISFMDEVEIRIQLEAVAVAFVLSLLLVMVLGMIGIVKSLGLASINFLYIFPLLFLFYIIGLFISKRKYK
jgi:hypothetical protein